MNYVFRRKTDMPEDKVRYGVCAHWIKCSEISINVILVSCILIRLVSTQVIYHVGESQAS